MFAGKAGKVIGGDVDVESVVVLSSMQLPSISSFMCVCVCDYKRRVCKLVQVQEREMMNWVFVLNVKSQLCFPVFEDGQWLNLHNVL